MSLALPLWYASSLLYLVSSYYLLLRNAFFLERFALMFNLPSLETQGIVLAQILHANSISTLVLTFSLLGLFVSFILLLRHPPKRIFTHPLFILSLLNFLLSFPSLSTDVFDYLNFNRIAFVYHANPWLQSALSFPHDPWIYFGSWLDRPSVYPPLFHFSSALIYFLFGASVIGSIIGFKLFNLFLYLAFYFLFVSVKPKLSVKSQLIFLANPLILIEFLGNAHNDLLLALFLLLSFLFLKRHQPIPSALFLAAGFLTKITLLLYLPIFLYFFSRKRLKLSLKFGLSFAFFTLLGFIPLFPIFSTYIHNLNLQTNIFYHSLPNLFRLLIRSLFSMDLELAGKLQRLISLPLFALAAAFTYSKVRHLPELALIGLMLFYLIIAAPMIQSWYLVWYLPLLPFAPNHKIKTAGLIFCFSGLLHYPIFFLSFYLNHHHPLWQLLIYLVMVLPSLVIIFLPQRWYTRLKALFLKL